MTLPKLIAFVVVGQIIVGCQATKKNPPSDFLEAGVLPEKLVEDGGSAPDPGRYLGFVENKATGHKYAFTLDMFPLSGDEKQVVYRSVARINLGSFSSHEYISNQFKQMTFNVETQSFQDMESEGGKGFNLSSVKMSKGSLVGTLGDGTGFSGDFKLVRQIRMNEGDKVTKSIWPKTKVQPTLTGSYSGNCSDDQVQMQVEACRWNTAINEGFFSDYKVIGRFGKTDQVLCGKGAACTKENYLRANYNPFNGALGLKAPRKVNQCVVTGRMLSCDECKLTKSKRSVNRALGNNKPYATFPRQFRLPQLGSPKNRLYKAVNVPALIDGQYYGYLHHESLDTYQLFALNVKASENSYPKHPVHLETVATLYFGEGDSSEFVAFRFDKTGFSKDGSPLVLDGPGEGFFVVNEWRKETITGAWYSKSRGRIGTVELQRNLVPILEKNYTQMREISGSFEGKYWVYELSVSANISDDEHEIYPLRVFGWAKEKRPGSRRRQIEGGSYDYFTQALGFSLDDGRTVVGNKLGRGMQLFWPPKPRYGLTMGQHEASDYRRITEEEMKTALLRIENKPM
jgi:hypothetical protein